MPRSTTVVVHVLHTTVHTSGAGTTILAGIGVLLALASLGWQAYTFFRSGSRVRVELRAGASDGYRSITTPGVPSVEQRKSLAAQGMNQPVFAAEVSNAGRGSTSVQSVDLLFSGGAIFTGQYLRGSPDLPFRMDGESEKTWFFDANQAEALAKALKQTTKLGPSISLRGQVKIGGKRKPVVSKNEIRVL
jgi:hypothetical protein